MTAAAFSALGLLVGFAIGFVARDALDQLSSRKARSMHEDRKIPVVSVVGVVALVLTVGLNAIVGVLLMTTRQSTERYSRCTADWQQEFAAAYQARLAASVDVDEALDAVIRAVYANNTDAFRRAVRTYVSMRDQQEKDRARNPFPPLPERVCGAPEEVHH